MTTDALIGQMRAMLESGELTAKQITETREALQDVLSRVQQSAAELDELRGLVGDLAEIVKTAKKSYLMKASDIASELRMDIQTVHAWREGGKIRGYRLADRGHWWFDLAEVEKALKGE